MLSVDVLSFSERGSIEFLTFNHTNKTIETGGVDLVSELRDLSNVSAPQAGVFAVHDGSGTGRCRERGISVADEERVLRKRYRVGREMTIVSVELLLI